MRMPEPNEWLKLPAGAESHGFGQLLGVRPPQLTHGVMRTKKGTAFRLSDLAIWVLILGIALTFGCSGQAGKDRSDWDSIVVENVRESLGLECPCEVTELGMYKDGGSMGGSIRDSRGRVLPFAWDPRMHNSRPLIPPGPRVLWLGAEYAGRAGSRPVDVASPEAAAVISILRSFSNSQIYIARQDSLLSAYFDPANRSTPPAVPFSGLPKEMRMALRVLHFLELFEDSRLQRGRFSPRRRQSVGDSS